MNSPAALESTAREATARLDGSADRIHATADLTMTDLLHKMETVPRIEQAKGVLSGYFGTSPDRAFDLLRSWSSHHNRKIRDICQLITAAGEEPSNPEALRLLFDRLDSASARPRATLAVPCSRDEPARLRSVGVHGPHRPSAQHARVRSRSGKQRNDVGPSWRPSR